ncbi:MAG: EAL domain-containing protein [Lachnospiraceae bacterium]
MSVYIARQPIFDKDSILYAYELLYRAGEKNTFSESLDGSQATRSLVSDAVTVFGIQNLTHGKLAFINFTRELLLSEFVYLINPKEAVIEILEDVVVDQILIERIKEIKEKGYRLALDDYIGDEAFDVLIEYIDIIKVDFMLVDLLKAKEIAKQFFGKNIILLAEKIETPEEFQKAKAMGYELFQGYYFAKPHVMSKESGDIARSSFVRIIRELGKNSPDYFEIAKIIEQDAVLIYQLLIYINTLKFVHTSTARITNARMAIVRLGVDEFRRWVLLTMARSYTENQTDEVIRTAFVRSSFAEKLAMASPTLRKRSGDAFMMGMFSLIDVIVGGNLEQLLEELPLEEDVKAALLGTQNEFKELLDFVCEYERGEWNGLPQEKRANYEIENLAECYFECITYADEVFDITN